MRSLRRPVGQQQLQQQRGPGDSAAPVATTRRNYNRRGNGGAFAVVLATVGGILVAAAASVFSLAAVAVPPPGGAFLPMSGLGGEDDDDVPPPPPRGGGHHHHGAGASGGGGGAVVVCSVDGTVYTIDALTGGLRGLFTSGRALVSSSTLEEEEGGESPPAGGRRGDGAGGHSDDGGGGGGGGGRCRERIVPGLDGQIYALRETLDGGVGGDGFDFDDDSSSFGGDGDPPDVHLSVLPINVMEVINLPRQHCVTSCPAPGAGSSSSSLYSSSDYLGRGHHRNHRHHHHSSDDFSSEDSSEGGDGDHGEEDFGGAAGEAEECGIVMGEKRSKMFALDVESGSISWMRHGSNSASSHHSAGGGGGAWEAAHSYSAAEASVSSATGSAADSPFSSSSSGGGGVGGGGRGTTTRRKGGGERTVVLLQRDDYFVRHVDVDTGEENWNVTVGSFSALDFPDGGGRGRRRGRGGGGGGVPEKLPHPGATATPGRRMGVASPLTAARLPLRSGHHLPPGGGGGGGSPVDDPASMLGFPSLGSPSPPPSLPSIAFGEDGKNIIAVDSKTLRVLWRRRIESVIVAVYGVGRGNSWVPLDVVDEPDHHRRTTEGSVDGSRMGPGAGEDNHHSNQVVLLNGKGGREGLLLGNVPVFDPFLLYPAAGRSYLPFGSGGIEGYGDGQGAPLSSSLVPYRQSEKNTLHASPPILNHEAAVARLGRHSSTIFVTSTSHSSSLSSATDSDSNALPPFGFIDAIDGDELCAASDEDDFYLDDDLDDHWDLISQYLEQKSMTWDMDNLGMLLPPGGKFHRTEHGLFLTWQGVACVLLLLAACTAGTRVAYLKQKEKWEKSGREKTGRRSSFLALRYFASDLAKQSTSLPRIPHAPPFKERPMSGRSVSLPLMQAGITDEHSVLVSADNVQNDDWMRVQRTRSAPTPAQQPEWGAAEIEEVFGSRTRNTTTVSGATPALTRCLTEPSPEKSGRKRLPMAQSTDVARTIDGIPLVRYSRYKSEFIELSPVGKGGFGTVFRCRNVLDGREYALKKIRIRSFVDSSSGEEASKHLSKKLRRVLREVKILALLDHPNIVRYYTAWLEANSEDDQPNGETPDSPRAAERFGDFETTTRSEYDITNDFPESSWSHKSARMSQNPLGWNRFLQEDDEEVTSAFDAKRSDGCSISPGRPGVPKSASSFSEDLGFNWDRGDDTEEKQDPEKVTCAEPASKDESAETSDERSRQQKPQNKPHLRMELSYERHILYIQMQLCSQKTLGDFLASPEARGKLNAFCLSPEAGLSDEATRSRPDSESKTHANTRYQSTDNTVDIPHALQLFSHIAKGVKHVHKQGLIHRDLKPSNCFIDDTGTVKVGDFGLSRESATDSIASNLQNGEREEFDDPVEERAYPSESNTAGVGTRSYASPEQMNGSDYDASTDVYSLGIMLFELCYPMYTAMERQCVFRDIRRRVFPPEWHSTVAHAFPPLHSLIFDMLSPDPSERPSSHTVADNIEGLVAEFVFSLDKPSVRRGEGSFLLRVEAADVEGILPRTVTLIREAAPHVNILQYGLKGQDNKAILEFALSFPEADKNAKRMVFAKLNESEEIQLVRQVKDDLCPRRESQGPK